MRRYMLILIVLITASCHVGEEYQAASFITDNDVQKNLNIQPSKSPIDVHWYKSFKDTDLNTLLTHALNHNLSIQQAIERLQQSRYNLKIQSKNNYPMVDVSGNYDFNKASNNQDFAYDVNQPILDNISFKINENETIGIVGKTGAGKTTIVNLLTRLYDVSNGEILIDGINIKKLKLKELHSQIVLISQDIYLFKGTIYDNIAYAKDNATYEEVIEAAKLSHAHDFIINLENGYDTLIGEGNINLSGGERQRISIARAILLNPKILIFDEATASLDTKTERLIQDSITNLSAGKTVILIAHRLSTLKDANRLIVIDNKKIVEQGTMDELLTNGKEFAELYRIQQEGLKFIRVGD